MGTQPGTGSYEDAYERLQSFLGAVRATIAQVGEHQGELHALDGELQQLDGTADQALGQAVSALEQHRHDLEAAQHETEGQLQSLAHAVDEVAERLVAIDHEVEADEQAFTTELGHERAALEQEYTQLTHDGFEALHGVLSTIEGDLEGAQQSLTHEFSALDAALQQMEAELEQAESAAVHDMDSHTTELNHSEQEFAAAAAAAVEVWSAELPAHVEQGCSQAVGPAEQACEAFGAVAEEKGEELLKAVQSSVHDTVDALKQDAQALESQGHETEGVLNDELEEHLHETQELAEAGAGEVSSIAESLFPDLDYALKIADRVAELFKDIAE